MFASFEHQQQQLLVNSPSSPIAASGSQQQLLMNLEQSSLIAESSGELLSMSLSGDDSAASPELLKDITVTQQTVVRMQQQINCQQQQVDQLRRKLEHRTPDPPGHHDAPEETTADAGPAFLPETLPVPTVNTATDANVAEETMADAGPARQKRQSRIEETVCSHCKVYANLKRHIKEDSKN